MKHIRLQQSATMPLTGTRLVVYPDFVHRRTSDQSLFGLLIEEGRTLVIEGDSESPLKGIRDDGRASKRWLGRKHW